MFGLRCQHVEGDNVVDAGGVNLDQPEADVGISQHTSGDEQSEQIIHQEGVRIDQAAASSDGNVMI